jgi:Fe-S cluster biogenesis protein NfuA
MKTAMQELLENLQKQFDEQKFPIVIDGTKYLEKEKEQIIEANRQGRCNDCPIMYSNEEAQEYYNQTYNQNK